MVAGRPAGIAQRVIGTAVPAWLSSGHWTVDPELAIDANWGQNAERGSEVKEVDPKLHRRLSANVGSCQRPRVLLAPVAVSGTDRIMRIHLMRYFR